MSEFKTGLKAALTARNVFLETESVSDNPYETIYTITPYVDALMKLLDAQTDLSKEELKLLYSLCISLKKTFIALNTLILSRNGAFVGKSIERDDFIRICYEMITSIEQISSIIMYSCGVESEVVQDIMRTSCSKQKLIEKLS